MALQLKASSVFLAMIVLVLQSSVDIGDNIDTLSLFAGDTVLAFFNNGDLNGILAFVVLYIFCLILCLDGVFPPVLCRQGVGPTAL